MNKLGLLKPGQYKTIQLNPGYYEIGFNVTIPDPNMGTVKGFTVIKAEESKVYFVDIFSYSFYNQYLQGFTHSMGIVAVEDELRGRYYLSKNFISKGVNERVPLQILEKLLG
ncbi:hypothetical protein ID47_04870 [Candidatus Paracaedibacter acanthamoebae]|uniref:Uncharacterized protein n=1 Tax=Candidatus Odyssella acanthamoebae TaxID=91604 RepID=A0A077AZS2_9PROT|nr:hypothetical protein ID47_04870 [Candidatus Paracaedibacter acanthamoebae]